MRRMKSPIVIDAGDFARKSVWVAECINQQL